MLTRNPDSGLNLSAGLVNLLILVLLILVLDLILDLILDSNPLVVHLIELIEPGLLQSPILLIGSGGRGGTGGPGKPIELGGTSRKTTPAVRSTMTIGVILQKPCLMGQPPDPATFDPATCNLTVEHRSDGEWRSLAIRLRHQSSPRPARSGGYPSSGTRIAEPPPSRSLIAWRRVRLTCSNRVTAESR